MIHFTEWLQQREWYSNAGHSEDWADVKSSRQRFNSGAYIAKGIHSKYQTDDPEYMKGETKKKKKKRRKRK